MSQNDLKPLIDGLERRLEDAERKASALLVALNELRAEAGMPPRQPGGSLSGGVANASSNSKPIQIQTDTFFGKRPQTAVREYLEMRREAGEGPAKPREIYQALTDGGYEHNAKDAETALVGLRAMLRKRSNVFVKVGNSGAYGLRAWYPDLKKPKDTRSGDDEDTDEMGNHHDADDGAQSQQRSSEPARDRDDDEDAENDDSPAS